MSIKKQTKEELIDKWEPVLDKMGLSGDKKDWMAQYAEAQSTADANNSSSLWNQQIAQLGGTASDPFSAAIFPVVRRVAATTISNGDVELLKKAENMVIAVNREKQIDSILEDKDPTLISIEDTEEYKEYLNSGLVSVKPMSAPSGLLYFLDYKYDDKK